MTPRQVAKQAVEEVFERGATFGRVIVRDSEGEIAGIAFFARRYEPEDSMIRHHLDGEAHASPLCEEVDPVTSWEPRGDYVPGRCSEPPSGGSFTAELAVYI